MEIAQLGESTYLIRCNNPHIFAIGKIYLKYGSKNSLAEPRSKVTIKLHYDIAYLHPQAMPLRSTYNPYKHSTPYVWGFQDIALT